MKFVRVLHCLASLLIEWTLWLVCALVLWLIVSASIPVLLRIFDAL